MFFIQNSRCTTDYKNFFGGALQLTSVYNKKTMSFDYIPAYTKWRIPFLYTFQRLYSVHNFSFSLTSSLNTSLSSWIVTLLA